MTNIIGDKRDRALKKDPTQPQRIDRLQNGLDQNVPYPICGAHDTFQKNDGQQNWYLCSSGHHFYKLSIR